MGFAKIMLEELNKAVLKTFDPNSDQLVSESKERFLELLKGVEIAAELDLDNLRTEMSLELRKCELEFKRKELQLVQRRRALLSSQLGKTDHLKLVKFQ